MSQPEQGRILELDGDGRVLLTIDDPDGPEGIVVAPDGRLLVADQRTNHISVLEPATGRRATLVSVPGKAGLGTGIDGIGVDAARSRLLIPDSPAGSLLSLPLGGGALTTLAGGLGRPVSAAPLLDGSVLVGEENTPGLTRVGVDGQVVAVVAGNLLRSVDEVVVSGTLAYVADLAAGAVYAVDPRDGRARVLVNGSPAPQGLALFPGGRLLVSDSVRQVLALFAACG